MYVVASDDQIANIVSLAESKGWSKKDVRATARRLWGAQLERLSTELADKLLAIVEGWANRETGL